MISRIANVRIDRPERYGKQLASHLGNKAPSIETADGWQLTFESGVATIEPRQELLVLTVTAETESDNERIQFILSKHLIKFATNQGDLEFNWN